MRQRWINLALWYQLKVLTVRLTVILLLFRREPSYTLQRKKWMKGQELMALRLFRNCKRKVLLYRWRDHFSGSSRRGRTGSRRLLLMRSSHGNTIPRCKIIFKSWRKIEFPKIYEISVFVTWELIFICLWMMTQVKGGFSNPLLFKDGCYSLFSLLYQDFHYYYQEDVIWLVFCNTGQLLLKSAFLDANTLIH